MSTPSILARKTENGYEAIYCHSDGYPPHHWPMLTRHYMDKAKVAELIALGDLSCLGEEIGERHDFDSRQSWPKEAERWCLAYKRDRAEDDVEPQTHPTLAVLGEKAHPMYGAEYAYVYEDGVWTAFTCNHSLGLVKVHEKELARALKETPDAHA